MLIVNNVVVNNTVISKWSPRNEYGGEEELHDAPLHIQ